MSAYPLELPAELLEEAQKLATEKKVPLSQWITSAINAEIAAEKARQKIEDYMQNVDYEKFDAILARVPDVPPMEGDELL